MTKLQLLHRALNERLMAAVEQIMEMVGGTVLEYEAETIRARKENEVLRRRLRWMEGEIDWPDDFDPCVPEQPVSLADGPVLEGLAIKTEPVDALDCQAFRPDISLPVSVCTADLETVDPAPSEPISAGLPNGTTWDLSQSYMAPLDFEPTASGNWRGRGRSQRMSFACPDCGKVFGREQRLIFHMRIHSAERPYMYRRRKVCFYGDKKRKKKLRGLSRLYPSKEIVEDLSDTLKQTEQSMGSANVSAPRTTDPNAPEAETDKEPDKARKDTGNSKYPESSTAKPVSNRGKRRPGRSKILRCLECKKVFKSVSRLAIHMKTHRKPFPSQEERKEQEDTGKTEKKARHPKKPTIRNSEMEVEKAKAGGRSPFQCPECKKIFARSCWLTFHLKSHEREHALAHKEQKQLPSKKMQKNISTEVTKDTKEKVVENSRTHVKKVFPCPYCDKVFTREGWLGPHIRNHAVKMPSNSEIVHQSILPDSQKRTRRTISRLLNEITYDGKELTKELKRRSEIASEQPLATIVEPQKITSESKRARESKTGSNESERVIDESREITEASKRFPEESAGESRDIPRSKKTFPCWECGKVYLLPGWLKTHKKIHKRERMQEEKRKQMLEELVQKERKEEHQSLGEGTVDIVEKKRKRKKKLPEMQHSLANTDQTSMPDTAVTLMKENGDKTSDKKASEAKKKKTTYVCKHCGKVYARRNWLNMHMLGHRKEVMALQKTANNEAQKSDDGQMPQEGSSTEDSTVQKEQAGGKVSYPCPFCGKVFQQGMPLMVHMQIHSGEKPYSYRQRKEQFYGDLTRPRVPDTYNQEPAIESSDEREKDGGFALARNQTSTVSQDLTSATEPMETAQPHSDCTGRKFSLLPLHSAGAASNHSMNHPRTGSESVSTAVTHFSLQPRIVLEPIIRKSKPCAPPGETDFKTVSAEISDGELHLTSDTATVSAIDYLRLPQASDDSGIVFGILGLEDKSSENTSCPEKARALKAESEHSIGTIPLSEAEKGSTDQALVSDTKSAGIQLTRIPESVVSRSSSVAMQQVAYPESDYMTLSDVNSDYDDDDNWSDASNNLDEKKTLTVSRMQARKLGVKGATTNQPAQIPTSAEQVNSSLCMDSKNPAPDQTASEKLETGRDVNFLTRSSQNVTDAALDVLDMTEEHSAQNGPFTKKNEMVVTSIHQTKENSKGQKGSPTCMICGLMFAGRPSLSQHMRVHTTSAHIGRTSSTFRTFKNAVKNNETKVKPEVVHVQTSDVHRDDSTGKSEILRKSDSATVMEAKTAKSSGDHPHTDTKRRSSRRGSETLTKSKEAKKEKKTLYCRFCNKACRKIELHLRYDHSREPEVIEALDFDKTQEERKKLLKRLYSKKRPECDNTGSVIDGDLVHCLFCQGSYRRNHFWKHALICEQKEPEIKKMTTLTEAASSVHTLTTRPSIAQKMFDPESECPVQSAICSTAQQAFPESLIAPLPDVGPSTMQKSLSLVVPESVRTELNPTSDPASVVPAIFYNCEATEVTKLDSESDPKTANPCIRILDCGEHGAPNMSGSSQVLHCIRTKTQQPPDSDKDQPFSAAVGMYDSEGHSKKNVDFVFDTDCNTKVKRKLDSQHSEFKDTKTKRSRQSNPSQPMKADDDLSDEERSVLQSIKEYVCQYCSAAFSSPYNLRRHVYIHTGERPYWCSQCNLGFIQKYRFRNHRVTRHGDTLASLDQDFPKNRKTRSVNGEKPTQKELCEQRALRLL